MVKNKPVDIVELQKLAEKLARDAGVIIKEHFGRKIQVEFKNGKVVDPVTEVDLKCQEFILNEIQKKYPGHAFIGEEAEKGNNKLNEKSRYVWVVDPLDGTLNFASNFPLFSSSIAVLYDGEPIVGAIHLPWPYTKEGVVVHAGLGNGVFCDDFSREEFLVRHTQRSSLAVLPNSKIFGSSLSQGELVESRNTGSIAVDLALTGMGVLGYCVANRPRVWDVAAGIIIVKESGGMVKQVVEPSKIRKLFRSNRLELETFRKFKLSSANHEANHQILDGWRETLIFGKFS